MWDSISAISTALGVVVATVLGLLAVRLASRTITRSELEHKAERADRVLEKAAHITALTGESKAALHVFWKEHYRDVRTMWADTGLSEADNDALVNARLTWLMEERGASERRAHEVDYAIRGAAAELQALVRSMGVDASDSSCLFALLGALRGSVRAQYFSLIDDEPWGVDRASRCYVKDVLTAMANEIVAFIPGGEAHDSVKKEVVEWFSAYLRENTGAMVTPAIAATEFHENFVEPRWAQECIALVAPVHERALTT